MSLPHNDSDSASEYQDSESAEPERPNRWKGPSTTWQTLTAQDRGVATSLDRERDADLSVHLYNAYALKQRAKILTDDPENVLKDDYPAVPVHEQIFRPPKTWTAWPLPPDEVPRTEKSDDTDEKYTYKRRDRKYASAELEDVLIGVTLRFARERFEERESADLNDNNKIDDGVELVEGEDDVLSFDGMEAIEKQKPMAAPSRPHLEPVVSADEERSRILLRPSVRNTLSKLDDILMALHHARKTCRRYSLSEADTDDETTSMAGSTTTSKRPQGRPRKFADLPDRSVISGIENQNSNNPELFRTKKTHRGRPQKAYPRIPGENQQDYLVRIARIQKKPLPSFAPPLEAKVKEEEPESSPERSGWSPKKRATSEEQFARGKRIVGLRDWSEVLGSAALVGIPGSVIARATQRCADLFGEGMVMRSMVEAPFGEDDTYVEKTYQPEAIPELGELESSDESGTASDVSNSLTGVKHPRRNFAAKFNNVFCPMSGCPRKRRGFKHNMALKKHLQNSHEVPSHQLDEYIVPSDDEMDGAVHVDGFLRPIKDFRKPKRRKGEVEIKEESVSEDDAQLEEHRASGTSDEEYEQDDAVPEPGSPSRVARLASNDSTEGEEDHMNSDESTGS